MTVLCYCSISQTVFTFGIWSGGPDRLYLHANWAAKLSCLGSSISGLTTWQNDSRAALRSGIQQKLFKISFIQHKSEFSKWKTNRNTAMWKLKALDSIPKTSRGCRCLDTSRRHWSGARNEMLEPRLDSSAAPSAWRYVGQVLHFEHRQIDILRKRAVPQNSHCSKTFNAWCYVPILSL